jgi:hypothetical protein
MAADSTAYDAVLKESWHPDSLEENLYQGNPLLENLERDLPIATHGDKVVTPVHTGRSGGYSAVPRTGSSSLNAADSQEVSQATFNWTHHWFQVEIETATVDETANKANAVASVVDVEMKGAVDDIRKQLTRQAFGAGDALIAECTTTSNSTTVNLAPLSSSAYGGYGYDAIQRGHLYPGLTIDIGTAADEDVVAADRVIQSVSESSTDPEIVISGAAVTTAAADYVSIANARAGATAYETNGLQSVVGTTTFGGINPTSVPVWKAAYRSTTAADLSLPIIYRLERKVFQASGSSPNWAITSAEQYENTFKLLQNQVRFDGPNSVDTGIKGDGLMVGSMKLQRQPDCPNGHFYALTKDDLFMVRTEKPQWAPEKYSGNGKILEWKQGSTRLVSAIVYRIQLAAKRRNRLAAELNLKQSGV